MKRHTKYLSLFALITVGFTAAPALHAQDSTSVVVVAPYAPAPPPPPVYVQRHDHPTRVSVAVGATRQLTQTLTSNGPHSVYTTDSTGFLLSLRSVPFWGTGLEANYQFTQLSERYTTAAPGVLVNEPTSSHELTGAFVFEQHVRGVKPFLALGGGAIEFVPTAHGAAQNQWRGAGLAELGFDVPVNRYCGFRVQGRGLFYRAPNFNNATLQTRSWVATVNPALSFYARW